MNDYISKPFNSRELYRKLVKHALRKKFSCADDYNEKEPKPGKEDVILKENINVEPNVEKLKHTDLTFLKTVAKGNMEFVGKIVSSFITQATVDLEKMQKSFDEKDWEGLHFIAHKMKSSIHFVGIREMNGPIRDIEKYAQEKSHYEELAQLVPRFIQVCREAIIELEEVQRQSEGEAVQS